MQARVAARAVVLNAGTGSREEDQTVPKRNPGPVVITEARGTREVQVATNRGCTGSNVEDWHGVHKQEVGRNGEIAIDGNRAQAKLIACRTRNKGCRRVAEVDDLQTSQRAVGTVGDVRQHIAYCHVRGPRATRAGVRGTDDLR